MKRSLLFIFAIIFMSCASMNAPRDVRDYYQEINEFHDMSKGDIYQKSLRWIAEKYRGAEDSLQHDDEDEGYIIGVCVFTFSPYGLGSASLLTTYEIEVQEGRARIIFKNPQLTGKHKGMRFDNPTQLEAFRLEAANHAYSYKNYIQQDANW